MYKYKDLLNITNSNYSHLMKNASSVNIFVIHSYTDVDTDGKFFRFAKLKAYDQKTKTYSKVISARFYGGNKNIVNDECWVHCNCEYFTYNCEVALATQGSSSVINSNGNMPVQTNPTLLPHLCKHLFKATKFFQNENYELAQDLNKSNIKPSKKEIEDELKKFYS